MCSADSPGRSISNADCVFIFDLDETILTVNSFRYWVSFMMSAAISLRVALATFLIMVLKKLHIISHATAKQKLQKLFHSVMDSEINALNDVLKSTIRPCMQPLMQAVAEGQIPAILATAAAEIYAVPFGKSLGFAHILATPMDGTKENRAEVKRDTAMKLIEDQGWQTRKRIFFTDHREDLPLIKESAATLWFGKKEAIDGLLKEAPGAKIIAAAHLCDYELLDAINAL
jgi:phosphoserine phosphatase